MPLSKRKRFEILQRDGFTCQYCGRKAPEVALQVDHIFARSTMIRYGFRQERIDEDKNLTTACVDCNQGKRDRGLRYPTTYKIQHASIDDPATAVEVMNDLCQLIGWAHVPEPVNSHAMGLLKFFEELVEEEQEKGGTIQ